MKKSIIAATVAAAVMAVSFTAYATTNSNNTADANQQTQNKIAAVDNNVSSDKIITVDKVVTADKKVNGGEEYKKTSFTFKETGETIVRETWLDPKTLENRTNEILTLANKKVEKNITFYTKDGAKHHINIFRDESGKAVSGTEFYYSQEKADTDSEDLKKFETFDGLKAMYKDAAFWKDKGIVTLEGKALKKILCGNEQEGNITCVYIDEATGFPVKEETYENGKLFSTMTYEFKNVDLDEKIFDASSEGVNLELIDLNKSASLKKELMKK